MSYPDPNADDIFDLRAVNRETGCVVVVRAVQYVAHVLPLSAHNELTSFFARILIAARPRPEGSLAGPPARRDDMIVSPGCRPAL